MKTKSVYTLFLIMVLSLLLGCSGGGGSGGDATTGTGYGTISMEITDAKPFIEGPQPDELWLIIEEVLIHQSGGGWTSLDLPQYPFEINLLAFYDGLTTQLVPPSLIPEGRITQIRMVISSAYMIFPGGKTDIDLDVPSGKLRTTNNYDYWINEDDALRIIVHFDLSQSIVQTGPDEYKLKPVLKLFNNDLVQAAKICGYIAADSFIGDPPEDLTATVIYDGPDPEDDEIYTKVLITKEYEVDPTPFCIYWLVPLASDMERYIVQISNSEGTYEETLTGSSVGPGSEIYLKNEGEEIGIPTT